MIAEIRLRNYRSYIDQTFRLSPGVNIVVGPNASGKTNLLEALIVACRGSSYRAADKELIKHGQEWSRIDITSDDQERRSVKLSLNNSRLKQFEINQRLFTRLGTNHRLPIVLFEPNHLSLLSGSPEARRIYLDGILEQTEPGYTKTKNHYLKTLRQRNSLLKSGQSNADQLFPWNVQLSQLGGLIALRRDKLTHTINEKLNDVYDSLSAAQLELNLEYISKVDLMSYESSMLKMLDARLPLDLIRGTTSIGPHRDDWQITIESKDINSMLSRGEMRSIVIGLKSIEADLIERFLSRQPLICLDDVFSELDVSRINSLTNFFAKRQSIITTTNTTRVKYEEANIIVLRS